MSVSVHAKLSQTGLYIYDVYIYSFIHISYLHEVLELALISIFVNKMYVTDIHCPNQKFIHSFIHRELHFFQVSFFHSIQTKSQTV